jgi:hypothetical protein
LVVVALVAPGLAFGQEFGLDLTRDGPNLQPSLAILPVVTTEEDAERAAPIARALATIAKASSLFSRIVPANEASDLLRRKNSAAECRDTDCLSELSHLLGVDRLLIAELDSAELRLSVFDWAAGMLTPSAVSADALAASDLVRPLQPVAGALLQKVAAPLGEISVTTNLDAAQIHWGSKLIGNGRTFRGAVPAGTLPVKVTASGYETYEETVTVAPAGKAEVDAELTVAVPAAALPQVAVVDEEFEPVRRTKPRGKPLWERPGFIAAAAGALVLGVGLGFGMSANAVNAQMKDVNQDGLLDITLAKVREGQRNATLANVLGTLGAVGLGAGVGWLVIDIRAPSGTRSLAAASDFGVGVALNGSF